MRYSLTKKGIVAALLLSVGCIFLFWLAFQKPSHDRIWEVGQERLPRIFFEDETVRIENYRNFSWHADDSVDVRYDTISFNSGDVRTTDVFISHFDDFEGLAHIFVSFGLVDGRYIVISLETRREKGEDFGPLQGLLRQYEIIYIVGSETDIVGLRTDVRDERVYLYETIASADQSRRLFYELASEINVIHESPKIYNTLLHNCTNEITRRVERVSSVRFPLTWKSVFPGYFDEVLYDLKIIDQSKAFSDLKNESRIDNDAVDSSGESYSQQLREK